MLRTAEDFSKFFWPKGHPELWKIQTEKLAVKVEGWSNPRIAVAFKGTVAQLWEVAYQPLALTPEPYSTFADIGRQALEVGRRWYDELVPPEEKLSDLERATVV